jgi:hypothetical protein
MDGISLLVVLLVLVPLLLVWAFVLIDIVRQPQLSTRRKVLWALACTVVWPAQVVYLLVRPQRGRAERAVDRDDPHDRLVDAVVDHEDGRLDTASFTSLIQELREGTGRT